MIKINKHTIILLFLMMIVNLHAQNLIKNGGFEAFEIYDIKVRIWEISSENSAIDVDNTYKYAGEKSLKMELTPYHTECYVYQDMYYDDTGNIVDIMVTPSKDYILSCWLLDKSSDADFSMSIEWLDKDYNILLTSKEKIELNNEDWQKVSLNAKAPAKSASARITITALLETPAGENVSLYLDEVEFKEAQTASLKDEVAEKAFTYAISNEKLQITSQRAFKKISIYDVNGKKLYSKNYSKNQKEAIIDIANTSKNINLLQIETEKGTISKKIITKK